MKTSCLFSLLLLLHLLDLLALLFDLLLLLLKLALGLLLLNFLVLHFVPDESATQRTDAAADCCARARSADCRSNDRTGSSPHHGTDADALFARRQRLSRASGYRDRHHKG